MKKVLVLFALCLAGSSLFAQQEKGDQLLRFNGSYSKYGESDGTGSLNIKIGQFITTNIEAGLETTLMTSSSFSNTSYGFYGTYNFLTKDAKMVPYAGLRASLTQTQVSVLGTTNKETSAAAGFYGGLRYFLTEKVNIDTGLSYDFGKIDILMWNIGLGIILSKK